MTGEHYKVNGLDLLTAMKQGLVSEEEYVAFLKCNILKYILRFEYKGTPLNDLEKASDYLNILLKYVEDKSTLNYSELHENKIFDNKTT